MDRATKTYRLIKVPTDWNPNNAVKSEFDGCTVIQTLSWDNEQIHDDIAPFLDSIEEHREKDLDNGEYAVLQGIIVNRQWVWQCRRPLVGIVGGETVQAET